MKLMHWIRHKNRNVVSFGIQKLFGRKLKNGTHLFYASPFLYMTKTPIVDVYN